MSGENGVVEAGSSESLFQSFSPCVCLPGHLYASPAGISVTWCSRLIWTRNCLQPWWAPEGRSCNPKQRVVGWSVQPFPPSLLDKFPTRQWLKFSALGLPVFLWQWVLMSHENKTFFWLKWNLSLFSLLSEHISVYVFANIRIIGDYLHLSHLKLDAPFLLASQWKAAFSILQIIPGRINCFQKLFNTG